MTAGGGERSSLPLPDMNRRRTSERIRASKAARICGISGKTLLKLARAGKVPGAVELPDGLWRFDETRLRDWLRDLEGQCERGEKARRISIGGGGFGGREFKFPGVTSVEAYRRLLGLKP